MCLMQILWFWRMLAISVGVMSSEAISWHQVSGKKEMGVLCLNLEKSQRRPFCFLGRADLTKYHQEGRPWYGDKAVVEKWAGWL
jgi:hypothetical protein